MDAVSSAELGVKGGERGSGVKDVVAVLGKVEVDHERRGSSGVSVGDVLKQIGEQVTNWGEEKLLFASRDNLLPESIKAAMAKPVRKNSEDLEVRLRAGTWYEAYGSDGKPVDHSVYYGVLANKQPAENVLLVEADGRKLVVSEQEFGNLRLTTVMDAEASDTDDYGEYQRRKNAGELTLLERHSGFQGRKKEDRVIVSHLILEDTETKRAVDLRKIMPEDWTLGMSVEPGDKYFGQDYFDKSVTIGKITAR
jgi:hypothetical protein